MYGSYEDLWFARTRFAREDPVHAPAGTLLVIIRCGIMLDVTTVEECSSHICKDHTLEGREGIETIDGQGGQVGDVSCDYSDTPEIENIMD